MGLEDLAITDNAKVTLLSGSDINSLSGVLNVGNGTTAGQLFSGPATGTSRPHIGRNIATRTVVNGVSGQRSVISIDGLQHTSLANSTSGDFQFLNWYDIQTFDKVTMGTAGNTITGGASYIRFSDCTNALITDTTWLDIIFDSIAASGAYNIRADGTNCSSLTTITVSNTAGTTGGLGYGALYELDPNSKITWTNGASLACTWTGTTSTAWTTPTNWSGCTNDRANYPDHLDTVIIPVTATQPTISTSTWIRGIGTGTGGGTITINSSRTLTILASTSSIRSDIQFQGNSATCTSCQVYGSGNLAITDNAKVTLLSGIDIGAASGILYVGDGATAGQLFTGTATGTSRPNIGRNVNTRMIVNGVSGQRSAISFNGLQHTKMDGTSNGDFQFQDWYDIQNFDNVTMGDGDTLNSSDVYVKFLICTNALVTDTTWLSPAFNDIFDGSGFNIHAGGTNCNLLPTIGISGASGVGACGAVGAGACTRENDPNSKINWN